MIKKSIDFRALDFLTHFQELSTYKSIGSLVLIYLNNLDLDCIKRKEKQI